jgi:hypothetical protein
LAAVGAGTAGLYILIRSDSVSTAWRPRRACRRLRKTLAKSGYDAAATTASIARPVTTSPDVVDTVTAAFADWGRPANSTRR